MPALDNKTPVADGYECKDLLRCSVRHRRHCALPADDTKPAHCKREPFLEMTRSEFGNPVVLPCTRSASVAKSSTEQPLPPDVGAMDAISARLSMTMPIPKHTAKVSHMAPAVPPLDSENAPRTRENSQVRPRTTT